MLSARYGMFLKLTTSALLTILKYFSDSPRPTPKLVELAKPAILKSNLGPPIKNNKSSSGSDRKVFKPLNTLSIWFTNRMSMSGIEIKEKKNNGKEISNKDRSEIAGKYIEKINTKNTKLAKDLFNRTNKSININILRLRPWIT